LRLVGIQRRADPEQALAETRGGVHERLDPSGRIDRIVAERRYWTISHAGPVSVTATGSTAPDWEGSALDSVDLGFEWSAVVAPRRGRSGELERGP
jgi:hypothetical protein